MTDKEFPALCAEISNFNFNVAVELGTWAQKDGRGLCADSRGLFFLPNGARRAPAASWTLTLIEIKSDSDRLKRLREKMREYLEQDAQLGWLINRWDPLAD